MHLNSTQTWKKKTGFEYNHTINYAIDVFLKQVVIVTRKLLALVKNFESYLSTESVVVKMATLMRLKCGTPRWTDAQHQQGVTKFFSANIFFLQNKIGRTTPWRIRCVFFQFQRNLILQFYSFQYYCIAMSEQIERRNGALKKIAILWAACMRPKLATLKIWTGAANIQVTIPILIVLSPSELKPPSARIWTTPNTAAE